MRILGTVGGKPFTEDMAEALAREAEAGYSEDQLTEIPLPAGIVGAAAASNTVVVHLPTRVAEALAKRAAATGDTREELAARAIENLLAANS